MGFAVPIARTCMVRWILLRYRWRYGNVQRNVLPYQKLNIVDVVKKKLLVIRVLQQSAHTCWFFWSSHILIRSSFLRRSNRIFRPLFLVHISSEAGPCLIWQRYLYSFCASACWIHLDQACRLAEWTCCSYCAFCNHSVQPSQWCLALIANRVSCFYLRHGLDQKRWESYQSVATPYSFAIQQHGLLLKCYYLVSYWSNFYIRWSQYLWWQSMSITLVQTFSSTVHLPSY